MFKSGDVVRLKSGGPNMTINGYLNGLAVCVWFKGDSQSRQTFSVNALEYVPEERPKPVPFLERSSM